MELSTGAERVLRKIFAGYQKIIIKKEFGAGLSGGRVFEVRPIRASGAPELPGVVKLAPISMIQQEWQAYQRHLQHRLPNISPLSRRPVLLRNIGLGGLRYALLGDGMFEVVSLRDYFRQAETTADKVGLATERLLRIMGNLWKFNHLYPEFYWGSSYDRVLPVNLLFQTRPASTLDHIRTLAPSTLLLEPLRAGDVIRLSGFILHKINRDTQTITLKLPTTSFTMPAGFVRCRTVVTEEMAAWPSNQIVEEMVGEVLETRDSRLREEVRRALGDTVDPTAPTIQVSPQVYFPNPLANLPQLLNRRDDVHISAIHGDLNLENILIEPETGLVSLIDFADAREDHVLHDLLRLETEAITRFIPEILQKRNLPLLPTLAYLYWQLHRAAFQTVPTWPDLPHPDLQKPWAMLYALRRAIRVYLVDGDNLNEYYQGLTLYLLGALKFKNLDNVPEHPLPKQAAFWAATLVYYLLTTPALEIDQPPPPLAALLHQLDPTAPVPGRPYMVRQAEPLTLAVARRRLAALPLEAIPALGSLPPYSRMPLSRNHLFVGRQRDLKQLARALHSDEASSGQIRTVVVTGLGGLGKTQLASEFVHRYGRFFAGGVFWLSFADARAVPAEIAACGRAMALRPDFEGLPLEEQVRLVRNAWQEPLPRLLIFDNCDHPELLTRWRPTGGGCRILVTSRFAEWETSLGMKIWPLEVLQRTESITLLYEHRPDADEAILEAIAQEVDDLPLALHLAGSYLGRHRRSIEPEIYLEQLRTASLLQHPSLQAGGLSPTGHGQNVSRTIALSYNRLDPADPVEALALAILARIAHLAPGEPISWDLLMLTLNLGQAYLDIRLQAEEAVTRLVELGLLRAEANNTVRLHRLVVAFVREVMGEELETGRVAVELALAEEAERWNEIGHPAGVLPWQVHLRTVSIASLDRNDERAARLCKALSEHFRQIGDYARARFGLERLVLMHQKIFGEEHEATARSLTDLGIILYAQDDLETAQRYYERALAIQEKHLGEHPDTAVTLNHLGYLFQHQGALDKAQKCHEQALAIRRKIMGEENPFIAHSLCNLAFLHYVRKDYAEARSYLEKALVVQKKVWGEQHPETARVLTDLGDLLLAQGELREAKRTLAQALAIQQKALGEEHPDTARVLNHLGEVLQAEGDLAEARRYYERALKIFKARGFGADHRHIRYVLNNLKSIDLIQSGAVEHQD